jgi:hypothetical protein
MRIRETHQRVRRAVAASALGPALLAYSAGFSGRPVRAQDETGGKPPATLESAAPAAAAPAFAAPTGAARARFGLALSGGGARGLAHIGVLKVLEDLSLGRTAFTGTNASVFRNY